MIFLSINLVFVRSVKYAYTLEASVMLGSTGLFMMIDHYYI